MFSAKFFLSDLIEKPVARSIVALPSGYDLRNVWIQNALRTNVCHESVSESWVRVKKDF
jgi:hypothetical protein